jgi:hypothetical protein
MNQQVEERIELIDNFIFETTKGESKKWVHYFNGYFMYVLIFAFVIFTEVIAFCALFHLTSKWHKTEMLVFLAFVFILQYPVQFVNFLLYRHLQEIKDKHLHYSSELNSELKHHLKAIAMRFKPLWIKIPIFLLLTIGLTKKTFLVFLDKSIPMLDTLWSYLPLPVFIVVFLSFGYANILIWKIHTNLKTIEKAI